ncbi:hypothetical protein TIFTF001_048098, partial [Ficus carica]
MASNYMKNFALIILTLIYFSFNHGLLLMTTVASTPLYDPEENIPLNCGSPDDQPANDDRKWIADREKESRYSLIESDGQSKSDRFVPISQGSVEMVPYMTARVSRSQFTYSFQVTPGLLYCQSRTLHSAQELQRISPRGILEPAGVHERVLRQCGWQAEKLNITFLPFPSSSYENPVNSSYVFVNGIQIVSMPLSLYYTQAGDQGPPFIGMGSNFGDYSSKALQTVNRLNVGGSAISPMEDTGMYREWTEDTPYRMGKGFAPSDTSKRLKYTIIKDYTAPDNVYRTAITMGNNATDNNLRNLTWRLPVDSEFDYLVRLHFCEFLDLYTKPQDRMFRIYLDYQTADNSFSVIKWSGENGVPIYKDYVVKILDEDYVFVDLHTRASDSSYEDVILNGIELFKLSSYDGNLAGPNPPLSGSPESVQTPNPTTNKSKNKALLLIALGSGVAGFLVLLSMVCCVVLLRLRKEKRRPSSYKRKSSKSTRGSSRRLPEQLCQRFSFSEIKSATNNFEQALEIGRGGFGN